MNKFRDVTRLDELKRLNPDLTFYVTWMGDGTSMQVESINFHTLGEPGTECVLFDRVARILLTS